MKKKTLTGLCLILLVSALSPVLFAGGSSEKLPPKVIIEKEEEYLSPVSSPGVKDTASIKIMIEPDRKNKMVIKEYRLTIRDEKGNPVRVWQNRDEREPGFFARIFISLGFMKKPELEVPEVITWDGKDEGGNTVPDGVYTYILEAWDDGGNKAESEPRKIIVDNTPPSALVQFDYTIFSPDQDGRKDVLPIRTTASSEDLWKAEVRNKEGKPVAALEWEHKPPEIFYWTGETEKGELLSDGEYTLVLSAEDRAGNYFSLTTEPIRIDTRSRKFSLGIDYPYFSPNGDGVQDFVILTASGLEIEGLEEAVLEVIDEKGTVRRSERAVPPLPNSVSFDGKDGSGVLLPDGVYNVRITLSYENGAVIQEETEPIVLDTKPAKISITASTPIISPNGDGSKDDLTLSLSGGEEGFWKGVITDEAGNILFTYDHEGSIPESLYFNGIGLDGKPIPDGTYVVYIEGRDRAGNRGESNRLVIEVDTRPTTLGVATDLSAFSPNGDGVKDQLMIRPILHQGRETEAYQVVFKNAQGQVVRTLQEERVVPLEIPWDGKDQNGKVVPDGFYTAELEVLYRNGNRPRAVTEPFEIDTRPPEAMVQIREREVREDATGTVKPVTITQETSHELSWVGEFISTTTNQVVFRKTWAGKAGAFTWNGEGLDGKPVSDGGYFYRLTGEDNAGNRTVVEVKDLRVTRLRPELKVVPQFQAFSPNGDGVKDTVSFDLSTSVTEGITGWSLEFIRDGQTSAVLEGDGTKGLPGTLSWDGKTREGTIVPDGVYTVRFSVRYNGTKVSAEAPFPLRVDTLPPAATLEIKPRPFSPDHDGNEDLLDIMLSAVDESALEFWQLKIEDPEGREFISFEGEGNPPSTVVWDGYSRTGDLVRSATEYPLHFTVKDEVGNEARGTVKILVDVLVFREGSKDRIRVANIQFAPWTTDYLKWDAEIARANVASIEEIAAMLKVFPRYRVRLEGHAVSVLYYDKEASEKEHKYVLIPLSQNRAAVIKQALVERGIAPERIETAGFGGDFPLVPFSDLEQRWVNRRVEFILVRE
jgi:flagellar hook assembly protein FlgD